MALYHKWDVKNDFTFVLQFFSLISDGLGGVNGVYKIHTLYIIKFRSVDVILCTLANLLVQIRLILGKCLQCKRRMDIRVNKNFKYVLGIKDGISKCCTL